VLAGLESGLESRPEHSNFWEPAAQKAPAAAQEAPVHVSTSRWQDEAPAATHAAHAETVWAAPQPRWEEALPVTAPPPGREAAHDVWSEMRLHTGAPSVAENSRNDLGLRYGHYAHESDESELFPHDAYDASYDAVANATIEPVQHIPANLIEFPRELIAARKARPRLAEGPYRDAQDSPQLSIFEVDPDLLAPPQPISHPGEQIAPPEWASIELEHHEPDHQQAEYRSHAEHPKGYSQQSYTEHPYAGYASTYAYDDAVSVPVYAEAVHAHAPVVAASYSEAGRLESYPAVEGPSRTERQAPAYRNEPVARTAKVARATQKPEAESAVEPASEREIQPELMVAPMGDRLLAGVVDAALVTLAFLAAAVVVTASTAHPPTGRIALIATGCGLALFGVLYQFLFLSYAEEGTPGMRYARIALCTFDDDNPSRKQMRRRIPAMLLSGLPLGLGMLWAFADGDKLGWHDRLTKTYQRKY
jgi:uncharacterized RDD family membrane protein YckC